MSQTNKIGRKCKLYYNTGSDDTPAWVEIRRAINVTLNVTKGEGTLADRSSPNEKSLGGLKRWAVNFGYHEKLGSTDTVFNALYDSWVNDTPIQLAVADGDIATSGTRYVPVWCEIFECEESQELETVKEWSLGAKHTEYEEGGTVREPSRETVA